MKKLLLALAALALLASCDTKDPEPADVFNRPTYLHVTNNSSHYPCVYINNKCKMDGVQFWKGTTRTYTLEYEHKTRTVEVKVCYNEDYYNPSFRVFNYTFTYGRIYHLTITDDKLSIELEGESKEGNVCKYVDKFDDNFSGNDHAPIK